MLALCMATAPAFAQPGNQGEGETIELERFTVSAATRTEKLASALPVSTTVVPEERLQTQLAVSNDIGQALAQFVPGYAPSRQKMTSNGESFRGRDPLYLLDGIPQSNPLRAGKRESHVIDPFFVEKIEVVHGSSAAQGLGATGGIINFVTRSAPDQEGVRHRFEIDGTTSTRFRKDGIGGKVGYSLAAKAGAVSGVVGATYEVRPFGYDGDGRPLGIDNVQGDTLDSEGYDLFTKLRYDFTQRHSLELMVNRFDLEQNPEWITVNGNRATGLPTSSARGIPPGLPAQNEVWSTALTYRDADLFGGELTVNAFRQDFSALYGVNDSAATRNQFRFNGVPTTDQSQVEAEKYGARVTWVETFEQLGNLGVVTGFDVISDETQQRLVLTNRSWVPKSTYVGWSPYLQLEKPFGAFTLHSGVRYELAELRVGDFRTIESAGNTFVSGGSPSFDKALFNLGGTYKLTSRVTLFGGFTQGFGMPDVGRVLRAINTPGLDVDSYIDLQPIITDNIEAGVRYYAGNWKMSWSTYQTTSKLGARLVSVPGGNLSVFRERIETYGTELHAEVSLDRAGTFGGYIALQEGKSDRNGDGRIDRRLPAVNVAPGKVSLFWTKSWTRNVSTRLQSLTLLDRDDPDDIAAGDFHGYTLVDAVVSFRLPQGEVSVGVENLADKYYITYFSQTQTGASADNTNYFAGRGRTLTLRYRLDF
jgi:iron complex outermembrane recepter protein